MSVKQAIFEILSMRGKGNIRIIDLVFGVRHRINRPYLMDGTVTRKLRELREEGKISYTVIHKKEGLYNITYIRQNKGAK